LLEISCRTEKEGQQLVREFGGSVEKLRADWLKHFAKQAAIKPLRVGSRLVVQGSPDQKRPDRPVRTIIIPAETAFGTGDHATTAMCLRLLERFTRERPAGWTMLDAGAGSGILAIAGSCLGAARVLAIDNDPLACAVARRNARANAVRNIEFRTGDVLNQKLAEKFDIITANLFSEILICALPIWSRHLARGGGLIMSGILRSQENSIVAALQRNRFSVEEVRRRGKWVALLAIRRTAQRAVPT
jgi:ribosomal protein L11 methyltransferase